jgi:hypothetical protein
MPRVLHPAPYALLLAGLACTTSPSPSSARQVAAAATYLRGVYACDSTVVDSLAAPGIVSTYPIFRQAYGTSALRGREAIKTLTARFCERWTSPQFILHDTVATPTRVVFTWSFQAQRADSAAPDAQPVAWGGITVFHFDSSGAITAEIGEESSPGPYGRLAEGPAPL